jgi:AGZA family xanthine/uracil permease-like MFS transporter
LILTQTLGAAGIVSGDANLAEQVLRRHDAFYQAGLQIEGLIALSQGFMLTCLFWSAAGASLIERKFYKAAIWMLVGAVAAFFGFIHAGRLSPAGGVYEIGWASGWRWALGYLLCAAFFALLGLWARKHEPLAVGH